MNHKLLLFFSLFIGLIAFTIVYCAITYFQVPLPRYYPTLNQWSMAESSHLPSMRWYAQTVLGVLIGCMSGGIAYLIGMFRQLTVEHTLVIQIAGWIAVTAAILMMAYIFQHEWQHWVVRQ